MSLATRCPACGTIFRVVQDQLKVSEGWVRCGQCHEVFHGIEALFDLDSDPAVAARRAAVRAPAALLPTRVFADQRASTPVPTQAPAAPVAARPPAAPGIRPGYTGFTPAARSMPPPAPPAPLNPPQAFSPRSAPPTFPAPTGEPPVSAAATPFAPVATRGTIAPRFAARLAEEAARGQVAPPGAIPPAYAPSPAPAAPAPFGNASTPDASPSRPVPIVPAPGDESASGPSGQNFIPSPIAADRAPTFGPPPVAAVPAPAPQPVPVQAEPPLVTPIPTPPPAAGAAPDAAALASAFAAPAPAAPMPSAATAPEAMPYKAPTPTPAGGPAAVPGIPADGDADDPRAGPPTLASMLPADAGEWPPRRTRKRPADAGGTTGEIALVDRTRDPRFLREAKAGARWRKPWVRAVLGVMLVLLIIAAVGQVAWPQRDLLAARWPATLPAWTWLCEQAGCKIEAPRAIASLALDGSSLTRTDTEHVLLFSADLHNRSDHEVRMPSFDLTFMDLNGEIVARKVLMPAEIGIRQAALAPEGELHVHARLQVGTLPASGFQADLFYP